MTNRSATGTVLGEVMRGKIALEEHFATEATLSDSKVFGAHVWDELGPCLLDFHEKRIQAMDSSGIEIMILSLNAPAVQAIHDVKRALAVAHRGERCVGRRDCEADGPLQGD